MKVSVKIKMPMVPNYLIIEGGIGEAKVDLGSLDDDAYADFLDEYLDTLSEHHAKRRKAIMAKVKAETA